MYFARGRFHLEEYVQQVEIRKPLLLLLAPWL